MESKDKKNNAEDVIELSSSMGGGIAGGMIGLVGGPVGVIGGTIVGTVVGKLLEIAGKEIKDRVLSKSEEKKIKTVYDLTREKIQKRMDEGKSVRDDGFFSDEERSGADEVFEGIMFAAQKEAEEKKLPYMANLFSNIVFDKNISREEANQLIKVAQEVSYRQLVIMQIIIVFQLGRNTFGKLNPSPETPRETVYRSIHGYDNISILTEICDLYRKGIVHSSTIIFDAASINPSKLVLAGVGGQLYQLMELDKVPLDDIALKIIATLTLKN